MIRPSSASVLALLGFARMHSLLRLFVAMLCLVVAGHCVVSTGLQAPASPETNQTAHCGGHSDDGAPSRQHDQCDGLGCCQPLLKTNTERLPSVAVVPSTVDTTWISPLGVLGPYAPLQRVAQVPDALAPPRSRRTILVSSLRIAPNAPPRV